jgi:transcriptional regulator with XRE-family HTH domain
MPREVTPVARHLRIAIGDGVRSGRQAVGWSIGELPEHAGVSKATVWMVESAGRNVTLDLAGRLLTTLGVTVDLRHRLPFSDPRQRDAGHARCVAYVQRRLESLGWQVRREVAIVDGRYRGWIDVLAWDPSTDDLLVIEVKTEIRDVGHIERTIAWYGSTAPAAARSIGWRARRVRIWLLVLATDANDERLRQNREALAQSFPSRAPSMLTDGDGRPGIALIDPSRRRRAWLMRARMDGRRSAAPYGDYATFVSAHGTPRSVGTAKPRSTGTAKPRSAPRNDFTLNVHANGPDTSQRLR